MSATEAGRREGREKVRRKIQDMVAGNVKLVKSIVHYRTETQSETNFVTVGKKPSTVFNCSMCNQCFNRAI